MGDDETPKLSLAAEAQPHEIERAQAVRELTWSTKEMAANLLRVIRGAGRPLDLPQQIINFADEILEVSKSAHVWAVSSAIEEALQSAMPSWDSHESDQHEGDIVSGALQWVASRLVHQRAQECAGSREMDEAIKRQEQWAERERAKFWEEQARLRAELLEAKRQKRVKARAAKPKPAAKPPLPAAEEETERPKSAAEFMRKQRSNRNQDPEA
jgi:hypothetical protein